MEIARQWLEVQRSTPSFAGGDPSLQPINDGVLHGPMPGGLDDSGISYNNNNNNTNINNRSGRTNQYQQQQQQQGGDISSYYYQGASGNNNNTTSRRTQSSGVPVHDMLLAKGKLYEQRREAMKERHVSDQLKHVRNPKLSQEASKLRREEPVYNRFVRLQQQKDEKKLHEERKRREEDEQVLASAFKPSITPRARQAATRISASRPGDGLEAQMRRREEKATQIRLKYMMHDMAEVRETPAINPVSERLAARRREKEGLGGMSHLEAMIERDRQRRAELWEKQREREAAEVAHPYPKITLYAANLQRDGDAADRLYQESIENEARRVERLQQRLDETRKAAPHTPRITALAAATGGGGNGGSGEPIEHELMRRHLDAMAHREELIRQQVERERDRRHPAINPVSDSIASRLPQTSRERLLQPKPQYVDANEPSFAPRINYNNNNNNNGRSNSQPQNNNINATDRQQQQQQSGADGSSYDQQQWEEQQLQRAQQTEQYQTRRAEKIRQLREEAAHREMAECTFRPQIHSNPNSGAGSSGNQDDNNNNMVDDGGIDVVERSNQWLKKREAKLQAQRLAQQEQQNQDQSYDNNNNNNAHNSPTARNPTSFRNNGNNNQNNQNQNIAGADSFVERLEEGRKRRTEQYTKLYATGSKWTGEATVVPNNNNNNNYDQYNNNNANNNYYSGAGGSSSSRERSYPNNNNNNNYNSNNNQNLRSLRPPLQEKVSLSILSP